MNNKRDLVNITEVYGAMLDKVVVTEKKQSKNSVDTFQDISKKSAKDIKKPFVSDNSGPTAADGFKSNLIDTKNKKKNAKGENFYNVEKFSSLKVEKREEKDINICMKSSFDKLFENVMNNEIGSDAPAPDLDSDVATSDDLSDSSVDSTESDSVASGSVEERLQQALDILNGIKEEITGAAKDLDNVEPDADASDDLDDDSDEELKEGIEIKELGDKSGSLTKVSGKSNVVSDETSKMVDGKTGDSKVTDKVTGNEKAPEAKPTPVKGKANVVSGKASNVGKSIFAK